MPAYRIVQEALTNVVRHAEARRCVVRLALDAAGALRIEVEDDGRGIAPRARAGVGLASMRERAEELGGTWTVERRPTGAPGSRRCCRAGRGSPTGRGDREPSRLAEAEG